MNKMQKRDESKRKLKKLKAVIEKKSFQQQSIPRSCEIPWYYFVGVLTPLFASIATMLYV